MEKKIFPGSIIIEVFIPPWDFSFMVRNFMVKAKSCICKVLFTKKDTVGNCKHRGEIMQKKKKGIFNNPVGLPFSHGSPRKQFDKRNLLWKKQLSVQESQFFKKMV